MIELHHGGPRGHSLSVLIALAEKGVDFTPHLLDLTGCEQHGEALLALNPAGQVPVLVADGRPLTETFFILQWLDDSYPEPPLGGATPRERYAVAKWGKYVETHIAPSLAVARWEHGKPAVQAQGGLARLTPERRALWQSAMAGFPEGAVTAARQALTKAAGRVAEDLAASGWLSGGGYSLADIAVFPHLAQFAALDLRLPEAVGEWLARIAVRPAVIAAGGTGPMIATMGPEAGRWG